MTEALGFFILVNTGDNDVHKIRSELLCIEQIKLVHCLIGPNDLICYGKVSNLDELKQQVMPKLGELIETTFNPIQSTETLVALDNYGLELDQPENQVPQKQAAWILTNISLSSAFCVQDKLLKRFPEVKAIHSVLGRYDSLIYVEADTIERLMEIIDDGIRVMRGISQQGQPAKALAHTDTRMVLMDKNAG